MPDPARILVVAGSLRAGAWSKKLARNAADALTRLGASVDHLDLRDYPMPPYDGDLEEEEGLPPGAVAFKKRLAAAEGFLFVSPEYNHSIPGTFKNVLDWASRGDLDVFIGKVAAVMASSPGGVGGMRMLPHLRQVLNALDLLVLPGQVTLSKANAAFDEDEKLIAPFVVKQVDALCTDLILEVLRRRLKPGEDGLA